MKTMMRDPLNQSPEASEQPYLPDQERRLQHGQMEGSDRELIQRLREFFNNSNDELATALGVRRTTVDRWEAGETKPNQNTMMRARKLARMRGLIGDDTAQ